MGGVAGAGGEDENGCSPLLLQWRHRTRRDACPVSDIRFVQIHDRLCKVNGCPGCLSHTCCAILSSPPLFRHSVQTSPRCAYGAFPPPLCPWSSLRLPCRLSCIYCCVIAISRSPIGRTNRRLPREQVGLQAPEIPSARRERREPQSRNVAARQQCRQQRSHLWQKRPPHRPSRSVGESPPLGRGLGLRAGRASARTEITRRDR